METISFRPYRLLKKAKYKKNRLTFSTVPFSAFFTSFCYSDLHVNLICVKIPVPGAETWCSFSYYRCKFGEGGMHWEANVTKFLLYFILYAIPPPSFKVTLPSQVQSIDITPKLSCLDLVLKKYIFLLFL